MVVLIKSMVVLVLVLAGRLAGADQGAGAVEVHIGGKKFTSFQEYRVSKSGPFALAAAVVPEPSRGPSVAGVSPSLGQVVAQFRQEAPQGGCEVSRERLAEVMALAASGKTGPLLLVADGTKVRMLELELKP